MKPVQFCAGFISYTFPLIWASKGVYQYLKIIKNEKLTVSSNMKCSKYETCAILHRFHILYISCNGEGLALGLGSGQLNAEIIKIEKFTV